VTSINYTNKNKTKRKIYGIVGAILTLSIPFFLMRNNSDHHLDTDQSFCPFKMLTGFPCPGCGITKSLVYFYEGEINKSLYYHVLGPFVVVFCVITVLVLSFEIITKKEYFNAVLYNKKLAYSLGIALGVYHFVRLVYFVYSHTWNEIIVQSIWK
jgi:hypothetical protein